MRRQDQAARHAVGDLAPEVTAHQVNACVDSGRTSGRGDNIPFVHVENVFLHLNVGIHSLEIGHMPPMRGCTSAVEKSGRSQDERA